jgi:segregation and condensation protein B
MLSIAGRGPQLARRTDRLPANHRRPYWRRPAPPAEPAAVGPDVRDRRLAQVEAVLFAAEEPLAARRIATLAELADAAEARRSIERLRDLLAAEGSAFRVEEIAGGYQMLTRPEFHPWLVRLRQTAGEPKLSGALLETLAIVAYRQPITRPEIDEIRGVDCGPVLKTLLDRALIRMIGKKEEVGRPILYGTTPEFLRTFSLKDLTELPTLRQFHELGAAEQAKVDAEAPLPGAAEGGAPVPRVMPAPSPLPDQNPEEEDALLAELDEATSAATRATRSPDPAPAPPGDEPASQATE